MSEALFFKEIDQTLFLKAEGHITAALCGDVRETLYHRLQTKPIPLGFVVDLHECDYMDSTFMGLLVGLNKRCLATIGNKLTIRSPSQECVQLLQNLGVLRLLNSSTTVSFPPDNDLEMIQKKSNPTSEIILNAHENLMELSLDNQKKFSTLQGILKKQIEEEQKAR